jgi:transposase InsO family protein
MISPSDRRRAVKLIDEAHRSGARLTRACAELAISVRTYQRWTEEAEVKVDGRPGALRPEPANRLSAEERQQVLAVCHRPEFASLPPGQIVPRLADAGEYIASESSFYRILRAAGEQHHRGRSRAPRKMGPPPRHRAVRPCQVWSWDITWLPGPARGLFFFLYLMIDVYSRKIVGWEVYAQESAELASDVVRRAVLAEGCIGQPLVLHADNGSPQKGATLMATLEKLGVQTSYSRPRVSDDNAYAESIFRTCKYRPDYPYKGFADLDHARAWVLAFVRWYNQEHRHSGIRYVTPEQRHSGVDRALLAKRHGVYQAARQKHPERWTSDTRNWEPVRTVWLNRPPELSGDQLPFLEVA